MFNEGSFLWANLNLRVCLVGGVEKWNDRKLWEDRKDFNFSHFCLVGSGKVERWKK